MTVLFKHMDIWYTAIGTYSREEHLFENYIIYYDGVDITNVIDSICDIDTFHESILEYI